MVPLCEKCENTKVIGSVKELPRVPKDLHRPFIDEVLLKCDNCKGEMRRIPDVLDVWFDSGTSNYAVLGKDKRLGVPCDLYLEGSDQHRGWFQSSLLCSMVLHGKAQTKAIFTHGYVVDENRQKMSKSIGNVVAPQEVIDKYSRDILRLWVASSDVESDVVRHF